MSEHGEPWSLREESWQRGYWHERILDADGEPVLFQDYAEGNGMNDRYPPPFPGISEEHLERIVACVNACAGVSNADLASEENTMKSERASVIAREMPGQTILEE